jgi:hypothetical protein
MKTQVLAAVLSLMAFACATPLHTKVIENIKIGDSSDKVKDLLGNPDSFGESQKIPGAMAWYYTSHGSVCGFAIKDNAVALMGCDSSEYVSPGRRGLATFGTLLKGAGQGLQQGAQRSPTQTRCTSDYAGGYNCTTQ